MLLLYRSLANILYYGGLQLSTHASHALRPSSCTFFSSAVKVPNVDGAVVVALTFAMWSFHSVVPLMASLYFFRFS